MSTAITVTLVVLYNMSATVTAGSAPDVQPIQEKPFHTLILDSGPIIKNSPSISSLLAKSTVLVTTPEVIAEIRDATTRARVDTLLKPFLSLRSPRPESVKFVIDFARRTGDLAVLSKTDLRILALAYEIDCELNCGDWRLKRTPGQKEQNGPEPAKKSHGSDVVQPNTTEPDSAPEPEKEATAGPDVAVMTETLDAAVLSDTQQTPPNGSASVSPAQEQTIEGEVRENASGSPLKDTEKVDGGDEEDDEDDDDEGWITPSNISKHIARDAQASDLVDSTPQHIPVATLTTDYAMQNVLLQINLNLISESLYRVRRVKSFALRCYACFNVSKDLSKQFCPRCGQASLTRVACSTDAAGGFNVHLKKGFKLNTRGDRYSIPKPATSSASGRVRSGGGTGGWGSGLILAEDQREYQKAVSRQQRTKERDLMQEDVLPGLMGGERSGQQSGGKIKVGAGRNVNAARRKK